jgi:hypothetical protein
MAEQNTTPARPKVFIGSSSAGLETAREIQNQLFDAADLTVWNKEDWLNKGTLERLMEILDIYNFAIMVLRPDDVIEIKGEKKTTTRDNVLLELGLFMGKHGREKVFIVFQDDENQRIASDLLGINFALFNTDSEASLAVACNKIRKQMLQVWGKDQQKAKEQKKALAASEDNPLTYEAGMLYRILNAASSPQYKPIDYSYLLKPFAPVGEQSLAKISEVKLVAEQLFYYYMLTHLKAAQNESQRLRVYFAYYLGDGAPLDSDSEPFYCLGRDGSGKLFKGAFVIGISTSEGATEQKWQTGLPLGGYDAGLRGKALSNAAAAFRDVESQAIDDTEKLPPWYKHLNFKVEDERTVYSVPVLLSDKRWNEWESVAPIGILTISGSNPSMINDKIKQRADHLAILLGFIFYLHSKQNPDEPAVDENIGVNKIPVGFKKGSTPDFPGFVRRAVSLRREVAKHFEEYFIGQGIHKFEGGELSYVQSDS